MAHGTNIALMRYICGFHGVAGHLWNCQLKGGQQIAQKLNHHLPKKKSNGQESPKVTGQVKQHPNTGRDVGPPTTKKKVKNGTFRNQSRPLRAILGCCFLCFGRPPEPANLGKDKIAPFDPQKKRQRGPKRAAAGGLPG